MSSSRPGAGYAAAQAAAEAARLVVTVARETSGWDGGAGAPRRRRRLRAARRGPLRRRGVRRRPRRARRRHTGPPPMCACSEPAEIPLEHDVAEAARSSPNCATACCARTPPSGRAGRRRCRAAAHLVRSISSSHRTTRPCRVARRRRRALRRQPSARRGLLICFDPPPMARTRNSSVAASRATRRPGRARRQYSRAAMRSCRLPPARAGRRGRVPDVFLRIYTRLGSPRDPDALRPWIAQLTRRVCLDRLSAAGARGAVRAGARRHPSDHRRARRCLRGARGDGLAHGRVPGGARPVLPPRRELSH